jgi:hypothetical protein
MLFLYRIFISPQLQCVVYQCVTKVFLAKKMIIFVKKKELSA